jgi:dihydrofolate synthase/folylpolyglutamate synthase
MNSLDLDSFLKNRAQSGGIRYDLSPFLSFLEGLGNPHLSLPPVILIAGTNGKGSTLTYITSVLRECGLHVGTYTSPHLVSYTERICINNEPISDVILSQMIQAIDTPSLTEFELLTAAAFLYFKRVRPDILVVEVGLGGRLDATNVVTPMVSIITRIGMDHQAILGPTLTDIAREKAGIIKPGVPVLTLSTQAADVQAVLRETAQTQKSPLYEVLPKSEIPATYRMQGGYQVDNLALASAVFELFDFPTLTPERLDRGLETAEIWGRLTCIQRNTQTIVVDAAHNEMGVLALLDHLKRAYPNQTPTFLVSFYAPKNVKEMMALFLEAGQVIYTEFDPQLAYPYLQLSTEFPDHTVSFTPMEALKNEWPDAPLLVISGSIYFIGEMHRLSLS